MEYAGLVVRQGADYRPTAEPTAVPTVRLLDPPSPLKYRPGRPPHIAPRRALEFLGRLDAEGEVDLPSAPKEREAVGTLFALGAVVVSPSRKVRLALSDLVEDDGRINAPTLRRLLASVPGGVDGLAVIVANSRAVPRDVGTASRTAAHTNWTDDTTRGVGGHFRSWAKLAGLKVDYPSRKPPKP